jgi:UMF1 family MFS transporter
VLPLTGAIADRSQRKTRILAVFAYLGSAATLLMYFITDGRVTLGWLLYVIAQLAFSASVVVYNAFLPEISGPDERDRLSARGWALGYLGGGFLLLLNLAFYSARESFGVSQNQAVRISLASAGMWWAIFTLIPLTRLRNHRAGAPRGPGLLSAGFRQLRHTLKDARGYPQTLLFLGAYLTYNDGIQSVIGLSAVYGVDELRFEQGTMITAILVVQFVAFGGALALGRLAGRFGAKRVILFSLVLWIVAVTGAFFLQERVALQLFTLAVFIGFVLGGSQALSRSLFSQMIPRGKEAEYFSLYEITERGTSWLGVATFATVNQLTGSYRAAIVSLIFFFIVGLLLLNLVDVRKAINDAGNPQPRRV